MASTPVNENKAGIAARDDAKQKVRPSPGVMVMSPEWRTANAKKAAAARWNSITAEERSQWRRKRPGNRAWKGQGKDIAA